MKLLELFDSSVNEYGEPEYRNISQGAANPKNAESLIKDVNFSDYNEISRKQFSKIADNHKNLGLNKIVNQEGVENAVVYSNANGIQAFKVTGGSARSGGGMYYVKKNFGK